MATWQQGNAGSLLAGIGQNNSNAPQAGDANAALSLIRSNNDLERSGQNNLGVQLSGAANSIAGAYSSGQQQLRQQQFQQAFGQAYAKGDREALKQLAATNPDQIEAIQKGMGFIDADKNQQIGAASMDLQLAAQSGNPQAVASAIQKNAGVLQGLGLDPQTAFQAYQQDPQSFSKTADLIGMHALGPEKYFDFQDKAAGRDIDRGKLSETIRSNQAGESLTSRGQDITLRGQNISAQNAALDRDIRRSEISKLQAYRDELSNAADFNQLRNLRTQFRQDVKGERVAWPTRSEASVNKVYSALTSDLDNAVSSNLGPMAANKYRQANAAYANEAQLVNNTRLKNVLQKGDLTPEVVNNLLFSNKPSEIRQLYSSLDSKGRSAARASVIGKAFERSGVSPDKFLNEVNRLGNQTGILFKGADRQYLAGLKNYLDSTSRASRSGAVTPTGQEILQFGAPAAVATDLVGGGGLATGTFASYGALARAYESKPVRTAMLRLANTPKGSSAFEKNLEVANRALTAVGQGIKD